MSNHFYDEATSRTRCGQYEGTDAFHVSHNDRVSCEECRVLLSPDEREGQWYPFTDDESVELVPTPTLSDFLLARIAEDEADPWRGAELIGTDRVVGRAEYEALEKKESEWEARVAADCAAKRRIVEEHRIRADVWPRDYCATCVSYHSAVSGCENAGWPCPTLRYLAAAYAHHPDYRQEWKP